MANTARRKIKGGKMFLPMDIRGGGSGGKEYFINVPKLVVIIAMIAFAIYIYVYGNEVGFKPLAYAILTLVLILSYQYIIRKFILEENYFFDIFNRAEELDNQTPDVFWNVASIRKSTDGDIMVFSDMKIACIIRLERDTIVGRAEDSSEIHYDAWSDFYKELHLKGLSYIQMNLMEPSGKDPRLNVLGNTASESTNPNIREVLELEVGYLKAIGSATLSEFDYIMIYVNDISRIDTLINDVSECSYKLLGGAYSSAKILKERDIYELPKSIFNVEFFDGVQAQMNVYRNTNKTIPSIIHLRKLNFEDKSIVEVDEKGAEKLSKLASLVENGALQFGEWSVRKALNGEIDKLNNFSKKKIQPVNDANSQESIKIEKNKTENIKKEKKKHGKKKEVIDLSMDDEEDLLG